LGLPGSVTVMDERDYPERKRRLLVSNNDRGRDRTSMRECTYLPHCKKARYMLSA
jgi:hypothetical protein